MRQENDDREDTSLIHEIEHIENTVQSLANALILLSSNVTNDPRLNGAIEEIANIVEGKSENMVRLTAALETERELFFSSQGNQPSMRN